MSLVSCETRARLDMFCDLVIAENALQNLISPATVDKIEARHVEDSLQLAELVPAGVLVDIGTGGGFPGLVLACTRGDRTHLVEPRKRRAEFLMRAVDRLGLSATTTVWPIAIEKLEIPAADAITARAVAPLTKLFAAAEHVATAQTRWVLPKGRTAETELDTARLTWQGEFELVPSTTDPTSWIVVARNVHRRRKA